MVKNIVRLNNIDARSYVNDVPAVTYLDIFLKTGTQSYLLIIDTFMIFFKLMCSYYFSGSPEFNCKVIKTRTIVDHERVSPIRSNQAVEIKFIDRESSALPMVMSCIDFTIACDTYQCRI